MISKREIARCGELLAKGECPENEQLNAIEALELWRGAHQYPMEQIESEVRSASSDLGGSLCASRLKRRETILGKLRRPNTHYSLRNLDDIAGCRCIVPSMDDVETVVERLRLKDGFEKIKDYIDSPKKTGYRSVHLFHKCDSPNYGYTSLRVEVQVRTQCQHAWATAVETYDTLSGTGLKFGSGDEDPAKAFALLSNMIAIQEGCPRVPNVPASLAETKAEFLKLEKKLRIIPTLRGFCKCVDAVEDKALTYNAGYYLLEFDYVEQFVHVTLYPVGNGETAQEEYSRKERAKSPETDVLLVKADSIESLKAAYPNYFSDITLFLDLTDRLLGSS